MKFGIISDTHGRKALMHRVADELAGAHAVDFIYHLGDDWEDAEELQHAGHQVRAVPGLWCAAYRLPFIPNTRVEQVEWLTVACAHAEKDLGPRERAARLVLFGHTHEARISERINAIWCNPGHLKGERDRGYNASYGVATVSPDALHLVIYELDGTIRHEGRFPNTADMYDEPPNPEF